MAQAAQPSVRHRLHPKRTLHVPHSSDPGSDGLNIATSIVHAVCNLRSVISPDICPAKKNIFQRMLSGILMVLAFVVIISWGRYSLFGMVVFLLYTCTTEIVELAGFADRCSNPFTMRVLTHTTMLTTFLQYYQPLLRMTADTLQSTDNALGSAAASLLQVCLTYNTPLVYLIYILTVVVFFFSLSHDSLNSQLAHAAITVCATAIVIVGCSGYIRVIQSSIAWFVMPCLVIVLNDSGSYASGKMFGRTPLTWISPRKTVEGFVGGALITCIFALVGSRVLSVDPDAPPSAFMLHMTSSIWDPQRIPADHFLTYVSLDQIVGCVSPALSSAIVRVLGERVVAAPLFGVSRFMLHMAVIGIHGSIISPFGGFLASALKRSLNKDNFGSSIPGHGGILDRMDCEVIMSHFVYVYYVTFVQSEVHV